MRLTQETIRVIIKDELNKFLNENFSGEDKWNKGADSDHGTGDNERAFIPSKNFFLIILNKQHLSKEYPKNDGRNHGLVSHAIKHSAEFKDIDIKSDFNYFKTTVQKLVTSGKDFYVRIADKKGKISQYKVNKVILELIAKLIKIPKENRKEKNIIKQELANEAEVDVSNINNIYQDYRNTLVPKLKNLTIQNFLTVLDFHHDIGDLETLDFFDGELINKYKELTDKFIEDNKGNFIASPSDERKKVAVKQTGNTNAAAIIYGDKISTFYTDKSKAKPEDFF